MADDKEKGAAMPEVDLAASPSTSLLSSRFVTPFNHSNTSTFRRTSSVSSSCSEFSDSRRRSLILMAVAGLPLHGGFGNNISMLLLCSTSAAENIGRRGSCDWMRLTIAFEGYNRCWRRQRRQCETVKNHRFDVVLT
nr:hypothetical protein Iba_chr15aCG7870 [Ipomoea batatas]